MRTRPTSGRPTLSDVAKKAGVSAITVSRTLRDPQKVSAELKNRINDVIAELNYIPDPNARALASARTDVIGVLVPSLNNNVFNDVLHGIYDGVSGTKYHIQIGNTRYSKEEEERLVKLFIGQGPAALIVSGIDQSAATRKLLEKAHCPIVQIMEMTDDPIDMIVGFDHVAAAREITRHLIHQGFRRIATISAYMDIRAKRRLDGYRHEMRTASLYDPALELNTNASSSVSIGREMATQILESHPDTDAFFCNNDDLALGALFAAQEKKLSVPEDLAIAGFNDMDFMAASHPPLTSVTTHRYDIGARAIELTIQSIEGRNIPSKSINLGYQLALRKST